MFSPATSVLLDLFRLSLALTVLLGHFITPPIFQPMGPYLFDYGTASVGAFFVLSGLVIRGLEHRGPVSLRGFAAERASRLLSVSLIALAVTCVADFISYHAAPAFYDSVFQYTLNHYALRVIANCALFAGPWGMRIDPFSDGVFWSLSFEAAFYAIYGLWQYGKTPATRWAAAALALACGPQIMLMMIFWLLGVQLYDTAISGRATKPWGWILPGAAVGLTFLFWLHHKDISTGERLLNHTLPMGGSIKQLKIPADARDFRASYYDMAGALLTYVGLLALLPVLKRAPLKPGRWVKIARFAGETTYPLYLLHYPLLMLAASLAMYDRNSLPQKVALVLAIVVLSALVVRPAERFKRYLRAVFLHAVSLHDLKTRGVSRAA